MTWEKKSIFETHYLSVPKIFKGSGIFPINSEILFSNPTAETFYIFGNLKDEQEKVIYVHRERKNNLEELKIKSTAPGYNQSIFITEDDKVYLLDTEQILCEIEIAQVLRGKPVLCRMGYNHSMVLSDEGEIIILSEKVENSLVGSQVKTINPKKAYPLDRRFLKQKEQIISITCGCHHSVILTNQGIPKNQNDFFFFLIIFCKIRKSIRMGKYFEWWNF